MESTMNASEAAAWALEEIRTGRAKIVVGRQPDRNEVKKRPMFPAVAASMLLAATVFLLLPGNATVSLKVRNNRRASMPHADIVLRSENGTNHECRTDLHGEAEIKVPKGNYRIYRLDGDKKVPSPTSLKCNGDMSVTAHFDLP